MKSLKNILVLTLSCILGVASGIAVVYLFTPEEELSPPVSVGMNLSDLEEKIIQTRGLSEEELRNIIRRHAYRYDTVSGHYLAGRFAQRHHDWAVASENLQKVLNKTDANDATLLKRTMVLSMGAGEYEKAFETASQVQDVIAQDVKDKSSLALLFLAIHDFKQQNYDEAVDYIRQMPPGSLSNFVMPLLYSWSSAAMGEYDVRDLNKTAAHVYHAIMISDFMGQHDQIEALLERALRAPDLNVTDMQRIGDIYAHIGKNEEALKLFSEILKLRPLPEIEEKIEALNNGQAQKIFESTKTPETGIAEALYDMARVLAQEYSDESARVFAHMAVYLDPDLTNAKFLLARLSARNGHEEEAIQAYKSITTEENPHRYIEAQRLAADLLEESGRAEEAITVLEQLHASHQDVESIIQIGDIHRRAENYSEAARYYNRAAKDLGSEIPAEYWHLHYVRGMVYEQMDKWDKAEKDLQIALEFQPDNPFVLNYLGYAWADQGHNLEEALEMIEKAVALRPMDGYITDSLGWVLYRMGEFEKSVPHLEKAVELRPYDPVINDHLGDAYWRVGRKLEARFQWNRAKNHAEEEELISVIETKLLDGLPLEGSDPAIKAAQGPEQ